MALPVAHSCFGLALGIWRFVPRCGSWSEALQLAWDRRMDLFVCILIASAPDIDFIFGALTGSLNRFHQTGTHTLVWISATALFVWLYGKYALNNRSSFARQSCGLPRVGMASLASWDSACAPSVFAFWFVFILLAGHLIIDVCTADTRTPIGIMLAWPFSDVYWHSKVSIFPAPVKKSVTDAFSLHNLGNVGFELVISLPFLVAALLWKVRWYRPV